MLFFRLSSVLLRCDFCGDFTKTKRCKECKLKNYCSKYCQTRDWLRGHNKDCKKLKTTTEVLQCDEPLGLEYQSVDVD